MVLPRAWLTSSATVLIHLYFVKVFPRHRSGLKLSVIPLPQLQKWSQVYAIILNYRQHLCACALCVQSAREHTQVKGQLSAILQVTTTFFPTTDSNFINKNSHINSMWAENHSKSISQLFKNQQRQSSHTSQFSPGRTRTSRVSPEAADIVLLDSCFT